MKQVGGKSSQGTRWRKDPSKKQKMLGLTSSSHGMAAKEATNHRVLTHSWMEEMLDDSSADVHSKA